MADFRSLGFISHFITPTEIVNNTLYSEIELTLDSETEITLTLTDGC